MFQGQVVGIFVASRSKELPHAVDQVRAVPGQGLEGDRYFNAQGTFWKKASKGQELTLIESEALEGLERETGMRLDGAATRRNLLTRGVPLNHLVGREFQVGPVRVRGVKLCEPCKHLEGLTQDGVRTGLLHRGGLRCDILTEGVIAMGSAVAE